MIEAVNFSEVENEIKKRNAIFKYVNISRIKSRLERYGIDAFAGQLSRWELSYINNLKIPKRRSDFLSGRIAGKKAVKDLLSDSNAAAEPAHFKNIDIRRMDSGAPRIFINNKHSDILLSISHSGHTALAIAGSTEHFKGIGIDIEIIDSRDESFINIAFGKNETKGLKKIRDNASVWDDEKITLHWTIKEALLKSINSGFDMNLKDIEINYDNTNKIFIKLKNHIEKKFNETGTEKPVIRSYMLSGFIISVVFIPNIADP